MASITPMNGLAPRKLVPEPGIAAQLRRAVPEPVYPEYMWVEVEFGSLAPDFRYGANVIEGTAREVRPPAGLLNIVNEARDRGSVLG